MYNSTNSTKTNDDSKQVVLLLREKKLNKDDRCSRDDGARAGRGSPCAASCCGSEGIHTP